MCTNCVQGVHGYPTYNNKYMTNLFTGPYQQPKVIIFGYGNMPSMQQLFSTGANPCGCPSNNLYTTPQIFNPTALFNAAAKSCGCGQAQNPFAQQYMANPLDCLDLMSPYSCNNSDFEEYNPYSFVDNFWKEGPGNTNYMQCLAPLNIDKLIAVADQNINKFNIYQAEQNHQCRVQTIGKLKEQIANKEEALSDNTLTTEQKNAIKEEINNLKDKLNVYEYTEVMYKMNELYCSNKTSEADKKKLEDKYNEIQLNDSKKSFEKVIAECNELINEIQNKEEW